MHETEQLAHRGRVGICVAQRTQDARRVALAAGGDGLGGPGELVLSPASRRGPRSARARRWPRSTGAGGAVDAPAPSRVRAACLALRRGALRRSTVRSDGRFGFGAGFGLDVARVRYARARVLDAAAGRIALVAALAAAAWLLVALGSPAARRPGASSSRRSGCRSRRSAPASPQPAAGPDPAVIVPTRRPLPPHAGGRPRPGRSSSRRGARFGRRRRPAPTRPVIARRGARCPPQPAAGARRRTLVIPTPARPSRLPAGRPTVLRCAPLGRAFRGATAGPVGLAATRRARPVVVVVVARGGAAGVRPQDFQSLRGAVDGHATWCRNATTPASMGGRRLRKEPGGDLLSQEDLPPSTIGAGGLNCRVRNGNGCVPAAMATGIICQFSA